MKQLKSTLGFTIVELVVVITIIGLLATVGVASYSNVLKSSRDSRRIDDFKQLVDAMELYNLKYNAYPGDANFTGVHISPKCTANPTNDFVNDLISKGVIEKAPEDPLDNGNCSDNSDTAYFYGFDSAHCCNVGYCLSINNLETDDALEKLKSMYPNRITASNGCDANIGIACTAEKQFHMCFLRV